MTTEWMFPDADPPLEDNLPVERLSFPEALRLSRRLIDDAVVIVPGIMGTELVDIATGKLLWGLKPSLIAAMWSAPAKNLAPLVVDPSRTTVKPAGLLRFPTLSPILGGIEPYTELVNAIKRIVRHPCAILEFGYDWRLSVRHNATLLADAIDRHIRAWRVRSDRPEAKVRIVAHSMGGLLCHALSAIPGATSEVDTIITLGTPFEGAAKAAVMINSGEGAPLPSARLQQVAVTMPGLYDLLPTYRSVDEGQAVRRLTVGDVKNIGGSSKLAEVAFDHRAELEKVPLPWHRALIGVEQPTMCSLSIDSGHVEGLFHTFKVDYGDELVCHDNGILKRFQGLGDGTVPRNSAVPQHNRCALPLPQQHGPIARADEAITFVVDTLLSRDDDLGPRLGDGDIGILPPDVVRVGQEFDVKVRGVTKPNDIRAKLIDVETGNIVSGRLDAQDRDGTIVVPATLDSPGLYRIAVAGSGTSAVTQLIMAFEDPDA